MPVPTELRVNHTVTAQLQPLLCFINLPGPDAEMTPEQARSLAAALIAAANECEASLPHTRKYGPQAGLVAVATNTFPAQRPYRSCLCQTHHDQEAVMTTSTTAPHRIDDQGFPCDAPLIGSSPLFPVKEST